MFHGCYNGRTRKQSQHGNIIRRIFSATTKTTQSLAITRELIHKEEEIIWGFVRSLNEALVKMAVEHKLVFVEVYSVRTTVSINLKFILIKVIEMI